ncbi:MAG TPA: type II toxin-antitoxin system VapC family toxin [Polyangia bacterium]|jgi:predicted nucleic acid-binding protein
MMLADSDVLIDYLRGREPARDRIALELEHDLATTAVSAFELLSGAKADRHLEKVEQLLAALRILPIDAAAAEAAATVRRQLESKGRGLAMADYLIAGVCLARSAMLLTRNREHFERVPGLSLGTLG